MIFDEIDSENYLIFAADNYCKDSEGQTIDDFYNDIARFAYINRALNKYRRTNTLNKTLVLNHLIALYNVFDDAATGLLYHKIKQDNWSILHTFIYYLGKDTGGVVLEMDHNILSSLEKRNG